MPEPEARLESRPLAGQPSRSGSPDQNLDPLQPTPRSAAANPPLPPPQLTPSRNRLTGSTRFSGCGAKLGPGILDKALCGLSQPAWPGMLADFTNCEDAGIFALSDSLALVQTVDFFPPIVDDPFLFGRIAAANALSDIYAMGGKPLSALALVCFPVKDLELSVLRSMLEGGLDALSEAGCALLGGHSVEDPEPKLGYAVTGTVHPARFWRNSTVRPGELLILTKPLGTGIVNMALRAGCASARALEASQSSMARLNAQAASILSRFQPGACTDVTGFGLAGHLAEMVSPGTMTAFISMSALPLLPEVREYISMGLVPEGAWRNREGRGISVVNLAGLDPEFSDLLFDPQTSGGLLASVSSVHAQEALEELLSRGIEAAIIGRIEQGSGNRSGRIVIEA